MKLITVLLGVSVAANAALLVIVNRPAASSARAPSSALDARRPAGLEETAPGTAADDHAAAVAKGKSETTWPALSKGTLGEMVARLRAAGYPDAVIRALLMARLTEESKARRAALFAGIDDPPYWKSGRNFINAKISAAQREWYQEQAKIMKELLGPAAAEENEFGRYFRQRQYGDLAPEKAENLQRIAADYGELRNEIYSAANGMLMPEDREKIAYLEKEQRADMAKVLTPAELENYEVRSGSAASMLRSRLTTFQPTEEEFRALVRATRSVEDRFGSLQGAMSYDKMKEMQAAVNEQAKQLLAPERYAEFEQATDPRNSTINRIVARYELPATVVPQVLAVQQEIQRRAVELRKLPVAERGEPLKALVAEATAKLTPLLGTKGFEAYKVYGDQWLQSLTRTPPAPPGTPRG